MARPSAPEVAEQLRCIVTSRVAERLPDKAGQMLLLSGLVEKYLADEPPPEFKGAVLERYFEPLRDAAVSEDAEKGWVKATKEALLKTLKRYYETEGRDDRVTIMLPEIGYRPEVYYNTNPFPLDDAGADLVADAMAAIEQRTTAGYARAIRFLETALLDNPDNPRALSMLAMVHANRAHHGSALAELESAGELVERVRQHIGSKPLKPWEYYFAVACIAMALKFDWDTARKQFQRAEMYSRGRSRYEAWYVAFLVARNEYGEALSILRDAIHHLAHGSRVLRSELGIVQIMAGHYKDAQRTLDHTLSLFPEYHIPYIHRAMLFEALGDNASAAATIGNMPVETTQSTIAIGFRALFLGLGGNREAARQEFEALSQRAVPFSRLAWAAIGAGEHKDAIAYLRRAAFEEHDPIVLWLHALPFLRHLRDVEGYQELLKDIGLTLR